MSLFLSFFLPPLLPLQRFCDGLVRHALVPAAAGAAGAAAAASLASLYQQGQLSVWWSSLQQASHQEAPLLLAASPPTGLPLWEELAIQRAFAGGSAMLG